MTHLRERKDGELLKIKLYTLAAIQVLYVTSCLSIDLLVCLCIKLAVFFCCNMHLKAY